MPEYPNKLWTIADVARYTGLQKAQLYRMSSQGRGPKVARLGRSLRYRPRDVADWVESSIRE